jgi:4-hydroxybenzoate polyprenyltransferase
MMREIIFKAWYLLVGILVLSLFVSTIVNPTVVISVSIAGTLAVLYGVQRSLKGNSDEY